MDESRDPRDNKGCPDTRTPIPRLEEARDPRENKGCPDNRVTTAQHTPELQLQ